MSLVDFKHLIAPFKNTVHLVSIIFVVMLFAVYRLATGGVEVVDHIANQQALQPPQQQLPAQGAAPAGQLPSASSGSLGSDIQRLLSGKSAPKPGTAPSVAPGLPDQGNAGGPPADLNDIEKALGINK